MNTSWRYPSSTPPAHSRDRAAARELIAAQTDEYLESGGEVDYIENWGVARPMEGPSKQKPKSKFNCSTQSADD